MRKGGYSRLGVFGTMNHYDNSGYKIGESRPGLFGSVNTYDSSGDRIKVAIWTQAIYNAFNDNICEYDDEVLRSKEKEIIDRIAVVNVKKSNGGSESEYEDLKKYALEDRLEIKRELEIIQPDIIVCGNNLSLLKLVLGEELQNDDTWDNMLALWKDTLVLDYYHPAVHYPNRVNYYALMAICDVARKKYGTPVWSEQNEKY